MAPRGRREALHRWRSRDWNRRASRSLANDPTSRGSTVYTVEAFQQIVDEFHRRGFQICTHACGDRGVRIVLDAYEAAARKCGKSSKRHRVEHCENLSPEDTPRFAELGVIPCMMPRHSSPELTTRWREAVGFKRTQTAFPWRELLDSRTPLAFASDWPVSEMDPLRGIYEAVARRSANGEPSPHRISLSEAIGCYTRNAAFACHVESSRGTLAYGKYADFVILSHNLFEIPPEDILKACVLRTVVGGHIVYASGSEYEKTKDMHAIAPSA